MPEIYYRYEDVQYAAPLDEWDRPRGPGELKVELRTYEVDKRTACGVWLVQTFGSFRSSIRRFQLDRSHKRFACPTLDLARESFVARKRRQAAIHQAAVDRAERAIKLVSRQREEKYA